MTDSYSPAANATEYIHLVMSNKDVLRTMKQKCLFVDLTMSLRKPNTRKVPLIKGASVGTLLKKDTPLNGGIVRSQYYFLANYRIAGLPEDFAHFNSLYGSLMDEFGVSNVLDFATVDDANLANMFAYFNKDSLEAGAYGHNLLMEELNRCKKKRTGGATRTNASTRALKGREYLNHYADKDTRVTFSVKGTEVLKKKLFGTISTKQTTKKVSKKTRKTRATLPKPSGNISRQTVEELSDTVGANASEIASVSPVPSKPKTFIARSRRFKAPQGKQEAVSTPRQRDANRRFQRSEELSQRLEEQAEEEQAQEAAEFQEELADRTPPVPPRSPIRSRTPSRSPVASQSRSASSRSQSSVQSVPSPVQRRSLPNLPPSRAGGDVFEEEAAVSSDEDVQSTGEE